MIAVPPDTPQIFNSQGEEVGSEAGPFLEGYDLYLSCHVTGGSYDINFIDQFYLV